MKIAIASDHGGYELKEYLKRILAREGYEYHDFGTIGTNSVDYPDYAIPVAESVAQGTYDRGILICGTGIGMSIVANKVKGIRAALCHDLYSAKATREHNDSNVLALGERVIGQGLAAEILKVWLATAFQGGRHQSRLDKLMVLEEKNA